MKLVILYGPPAVGKYTIGKEVAAKLGYVFFHNHLTIDLLKSLYEKRDQVFEEVDRNITVEIMRGLIASQTPGALYTFVFRNKDDLDFIERISSLVSDEADVQLVQLLCSEDELLQRVTSGSRKEFEKVHKPEHLQKFFAEHGVNNAIPIAHHTQIDTTNLNVEESVKQVLQKLM